RRLIRSTVVLLQALASTDGNATEKMPILQTSVSLSIDTLSISSPSNLLTTARSAYSNSPSCSISATETDMATKRATSSKWTSYQTRHGSVIPSPPNHI